MDAKLKHLEFVQSVIDRMARNSFLLKGWSVTLVSAIFALALKEGSAAFVPIAFLPVSVFWFLDAYFLRQERMYRKLYDAVRVKDEQHIDFDLNASGYGADVASYCRVMFSITLKYFHGMLFLTVLLVNVCALSRQLWRAGLLHGLG